MFCSVTNFEAKRAVMQIFVYLTQRLLVNVITYFLHLLELSVGFNNASASVSVSAQTPQKELPSVTDSFSDDPEHDNVEIEFEETVSEEGTVVWTITINSKKRPDFVVIKPVDSQLDTNYIAQEIDEVERWWERLIKGTSPKKPLINKSQQNHIENSVRFVTDAKVREAQDKLLDELRPK